MTTNISNEPKSDEKVYIEKSLKLSSKNKM